ncbi:MAG: M23 family metallopeptidase [Vicinamibacterales bacterium]
MRFFRIGLLVSVALLIAGTALAWFRAGSQPGPTIIITSPATVIGRTGNLEITAESPTTVTRVTATLEQNGQSTPIASFDNGAVTQGIVKQASAGSLTLVSPIGKSSQPSLVAGTATIKVTAVRPVFFGIRSAASTVTHQVQVRLDPPRVAVVSIHQFINVGGAEFVVLNVTPEDVDAGVKVGDDEYRAYPGKGVGLTDPALRVAFFALKHDQDPQTPMVAYARDETGNAAITPLEHQPTNKKFLQSKIPIDQAFLDRVVPAIAANVPGLKIDTSSPDGLLKGFLSINGDVRKQNAETIAALSHRTKPEMLWKDAFAQMGNSQVESRFADRRTYFFDNQEIDRQVHLGFDLASVQHAPVHAANAGVVVHAAYLGIYGNCVIIDHGLGVQSLYGHMSSLAVKVGDSVTKGQEIGRTGSTGMAGGDHLHFTMLLQGTPVNPVEWWDQHWMEDRVFRKIREAGGTPP